LSRYRPFLLGVNQKILDERRGSSSGSGTSDTTRGTLHQESRDGTGESLVDIAAIIERDNEEASSIPAEGTADVLNDPSNEPHPDERQVGLDTRRSFVYYPTNLHSREKTRLQEELNEVIITVLRRRKALSYFQVRRTGKGSFSDVADSLSIGIPRHYLGAHFPAV
jgi:hypothetical protein